MKQVITERAGRFKRGQSGNPKGRPKGAKSIIPSVRALLNEVQEGHADGIKTALAKVATGSKTALGFQELRAKTNREIGAGTVAEVEAPDGTKIRLSWPDAG